MRRMAIIFSVVTGGMLVLGIIENLTNFRWASGDQNTFFGNPRVVLNDGKVVLILTGFLVIASAAMWYLALRKGQSDQRGS
jgi:hypothetical protein